MLSYNRDCLVVPGIGAIQGGCPDPPARTSSARNPSVRNGRIGGSRRRLSLLPSASERAINLYQRLEFAELSLRERELSRKESRLTVQDFEVARGAPPVAHVRQVGGVLRGTCQLLLLAPDLLAFPIGN